MIGLAWAAVAFGSTSVLCMLLAAVLDVVRRRKDKRERQAVAIRQSARDLDLPFPEDDG